MSKTLATILADTRALVATKQASFKKQALTGTNPDSMPGSEHDSKTPDEAKKPNPETRDGTMVPSSGLTTEGAGDDSAVTRGHALEADEAAKEPKKKPAVTADANAKEASDGTARLANEIVSLIGDYQKAASAPVVATPETKVAAAAVVAPKAPAVEKKGGLDMVLTSDVMAKVAAIVLSTDEGVKVVEDILLKQAGAEAANKVFDFLAQQSELAEKQAEFDRGAADAQALIDRQIYEAGVKAGSADRGNADMYFKLGQAAADASLEGAGTVPGGAEAAGDMAAPADAGADAGAEAGGEDLSIEDIAQALQSLVEDGTLQPEEAEQVIQALVGGEGAEGAEAAGPEAGAPEQAVEAGPEAAPAGGEPSPEAAAGKIASAADLLTAIRALKR